MSLPSLLRALADAVGSLDAAGVIAPANAAMSRLLASLGDGPGTIDALLARSAQSADRDSLTRLSAGETIDLQVDAGRWRLRQVTADGVRWVIAQDVTGVEQASAMRWERARARKLAQLATAIVHDLNNHLNACIGLAIVGRSAAVTEADRRYVDALTAGTQRGARLLQALVRLLARAPVESERIDLRTLVDEVVSMFDQAARVGGTTLSVAHPAGAAMVRTNATEAEQALLAGVGYLLALAPKRIDVQLSSAQSMSAGGRTRSGWQLRCRAVEVDPRAARPAVAALGLAGDLLREPDGAPSPRELVDALLLQRRLGGDLAGCLDGPVLQIDYWWPAPAAGAGAPGASGGSDAAAAGAGQ